MTFEVVATLTGIHSRSEETVKITRDFDRGRTTARILEKTFENDAQNLVKTEISSGLDCISDGQLLWQDFIRPFSESIKGLKSGADLSRWFDTNSFYRKPFVVGKLGFPKDSSFILKYSVGSALRLVSKEKGKKKVSVPGPYTLASLVDDKKYGEKTILIEEFAKILAKVIDSLEAEEFNSVQINEPALVYRYGESALTNKAHLEAFLYAFSKHLSRSRVQLILHTYFGDCRKILKDLISLPGVSAIGVDFTQTSLSDIDGTKFDEKALCCGCVDGRNSLIETPEWISRFSLEAVRMLKPSGLFILPSCDLKYLPRAYADEKIKAIGSAARLVRKEFK